MLSSLITKLFSSPNERLLRSFNAIVRKVNALESDIKLLSDGQLSNQTNIFRSRLASNETLDQLLPEAFATVREVSKRITGKRHFDVQLLGAIALHHGMIAEMKTGEGKTLMSTLAIYLNALTGEGVHVVTVNDYLARRDCEWMADIFRFLGMSIMYIDSTSNAQERASAYACDITYGTNNEFGFDYLRDNLKHDISEIVQRKHNFVIIDEVDSVLIDEARTPLIISGQAEQNIGAYEIASSLSRKLSDEDYELDEKMRNVVLTEHGNENLEQILRNSGLLSAEDSLYSLNNMNLVHHINQALRADHLYKRDVDYVVHDGKVMIIDEFTGRILEGRRYSDGLHQAIEAKEGVKIHNENQTIASITFQNYFRMYKKLAGMTGTAVTEAAEFSTIYGLGVLVVPTNVPVTRVDEEDVIYSKVKEKYQAIVEEVVVANKNEQPVLVGTVSVEKSEIISRLLKEKGISHNVLNAKHHAKEAEIIAQAGRSKAVTVATNMAGRGTDIMLGGNPEVIIKQRLIDDNKFTEEEIKIQVIEDVLKDRDKVMRAGGLLVIGTERHESRRIDNQLRGRAGRQGDPGRSKFYLSLQDDLMRIFGSEKIGTILSKLGLKDDEAIIHPWISKSLEKAQRQVESKNYEARKQLLQFDNVMNEQREIIYKKRRQILSQEEPLTLMILEMSSDFTDKILRAFIPINSFKEEWDVENLNREFTRIYGRALNLEQISEMNSYEVVEYVKNQSNEIYDSKLSGVNEKSVNNLIQYIFIITINHLWCDHLASLDRLKAGIHLRSYGQQNPLSEYQTEAFVLFKNMILELKEQVLQRFMYSDIMGETLHDDAMKLRQQFKNDGSQQCVLNNENSDVTVKLDSRVNVITGKNSKCPCGSNKKYKYCHGAT